MPASEAIRLTLAPGTYEKVDLPGGGSLTFESRTVVEGDTLFLSAAAGATYEFTVTGSGKPHQPWAFGTTVRSVEFGTIGTVLTDDGIDVQVLLPTSGYVVRTGRSIWEPDRA